MSRSDRKGAYFKFNGQFCIRTLIDFLLISDTNKLFRFGEVVKLSLDPVIAPGNS